MVRSDIEREYTERTRRYSDIVSINENNFLLRNLMVYLKIYLNKI